MQTGSFFRKILVVLILAAAMLAGVMAPPATAQAPAAPLPAVPPSLPFADNPDPLLCGIPRPDGRTATITGTYAGQLVQPIVYFYDSHLRNEVIGQVYPGTQVEVKLSQANPELNYYFVRTVGVQPVQSGWVPEPFVDFGTGS